MKTRVRFSPPSRLGGHTAILALWVIAAFLAFWYGIG